MPEFDFIIPAWNGDMLHRALSMLTFQKDRSFRVCVMDLTDSGEAGAVAAEFEDRLPLRTERADASAGPLWKRCLDAAPAAEWVCFLRPDVTFTDKSLPRMRKCILDHPAYDVFHWNLAEPFRKYGLRVSPDKLFTHVFVDGGVAPLSSFVFRAQALRDAFDADPEAAGMDLSVILAAAKKNGIRTARWERIGYTAPAPATDPALVEKDVRARLAFFRWSERFFGEEYPLDVSDRLALFSKELARLYPSFSPDALKEDLYSFAVVSGPIRKMRAASALKAALKERQQTLQ